MITTLNRVFSNRSNTPPTITGLGLLLLAVMVYAPGLQGPAMFDDGPAIFDNPVMTAINGFDKQQLGAAIWSSDSGPLKRPVSMLSFALNYAVTGDDLYAFKATNLAVHLATGLSLAYLTWLLLAIYRQRFQVDISDLRLRWLGILVAGTWLLHPLNLTPVLHIVQRMTSLCALFTVWGLIAYLKGRMHLLADGRSKPGWAWLGVGLLGCGALASLSKENGALLPFFMLLLEALWFDFACRTAQGRKILLGVCAAFLLLAGVFALHFLGAFQPGGLASAYQNRPFDLSERLLSQGRILWFYLYLLVWPDIRHMGVFHDDFLLSTSLVAPLSTLLAWLGWLLVVLLTLLLHRKAPLFCFGVGFYLIGHSMESSIVALDLIYEHRNYLPVYGVLLALFYYLSHPRISVYLRWPLASGISATMLIILALSTSARANEWSEKISLLAADIQNHPQSVRSNLMLAQTLFTTVDQHMASGANSKNFQDLRVSLRELLQNTSRMDDYYLNAHIMLLALDAMEGKPLNTDALNNLIQRLQQPPLSNNSLEIMYSLVEKRILHGGGLSTETLQQLFTATAKNPRLQGNRKAGFLGIYAKLAEYCGDQALALELAKQAVALNPHDSNLRTILAAALLKNGQLLKVKEHLDKVKHEG